MSQAVIGWLIAIVVFIVAEAATVTLVSVWFIGGAVCALIAAILGAGLGVQLAVFLVVSAALLAFACPAARKMFKAVKKMLAISLRITYNPHSKRIFKLRYRETGKIAHMERVYCVHPPVCVSCRSRQGIFSLIFRE